MREATMAIARRGRRYVGGMMALGLAVLATPDAAAGIFAPIIQNANPTNISMSQGAIRHHSA
ncbi:MAG: hypothetical protein HC888_17470 [Candidatus Competibacteraceae bacterium]|nr:hypothetical protein [Candidatus Competibacteraceae bacterium]